MDPDGAIGLVLAGGGARGAYEIGALSELLPHVAQEESQKPEDWRPDVIVGTSVGAINASYLAATAEQELTTSLDRGLQIWEKLMDLEKVVSRIPSIAQAKAFFATLGDALDIPGVHARSLVDASPLEGSLTGKIPFGQIEQNVKSGRITAAAVVATLSVTSLSRVFFSSSGPQPPYDDKRGVEYLRTELTVDHVLASAAIPGLFRAREVRTSPKDKEWYVDGGTRLNTPITPALKLGAERLIIIALNCPFLGKRDPPAENREPELLDAAEQLMQAVLVDPLVNDLHTLTLINKILRTERRDRSTRSAGKEKVVPYILVAPDNPHALGQIAVDVLKDRYGKLNSLRRWGTLGLLGDVLDVPKDKVRGELFSHLFFDAEFARRLIEQGRRDAQCWLAQAENDQHDMGLWRTDPL